MFSPRNAHSSTTLVSIQSKKNKSITALLEYLREEHRMYSFSHQLDSVPLNFVYIPSLKEIYIGTEDGTLVQFDLKARLEINRYKYHKKCISIINLALSEKFIVTASPDSSIGIFDISQASYVLTTSILPYIPESLCIFEADHLICIGSNDPSIVVWDYKTEVNIKLSGHTSSITSLLSLDPNTLISSSCDFTLRVWDLRTNTQTHVLKGHTSSINTFIISKNKETISSGGGDSSIRLWSLINSTEIVCLEGHTGEIYSLCFSPDEELLASGSQDKTVRVWDLNTKTVVYKTEEKISHIDCVRISQNSNLLIYSSDNLITIDNLKEQRNEAVLEGHSGSLTQFESINDGNFALSISYDKTVKFWKTKLSRTKRCFEAHTKNVSCLLIMSDNSFIISGGWDSLIIIWKMNEVKPFKVLKDHKHYISSLAETDDLKKVLSTSWDNTIKIWSVGLFTLIYTLDGPSKKIYRVSTSNNSEYLACNSGDFKIWIWSLESLSLIKCLSYNNTAYAPKFTYLNKVVITNLDGYLHIFDIGLDRIENEYKFNSGVIGFQNSKDWSTLFLCLLDKSIVVWDLIKFELIGIIQEHDCKNSLQIHTLSSDLFTVLSKENEFKVFDVEKRLEIFSLTSSTSISSSLCTNNCNFIIAGTKEGPILIFNIRERRTEAVLRGHTDSVESLAISKCNLYLISGSRNGSIRKWKLREYISDVENLDFLISTGIQSIPTEKYAFLKQKSHTNFVDDYDDARKIYPNLIYNGFRQRFSRKNLPTFSDCQISFSGKENLLHLYSYLGYYTHLEKSLEHGCPIMKDEQGHSPIYYSILRGSERCTNVLLKFLINLSVSEENHQKYLEYNYALRKEIYKIIKLPCELVPDYLESIFIVNRNTDLPNSVRNFIPPVLIFTDHQKIFFEKFSSKKKTKFENFVEFRSTPFELDLTDGSLECHHFLKSLFNCRNQNIFTTKLVRAVLDYKFNHFYRYILFRSFILCMNLTLLVLSLLYQENYKFLLVLFMIVNIHLIIHEMLQIKYEGLSVYLCGFHNKLNLLSLFFSITWASVHLYDQDYSYIKWFMVFTNFLKGLHIFEAFSITRFYVLLLFSIIVETCPFLIIFFYNTLAFGALYLASVGTRISVFNTVWRVPFDVNFAALSSPDSFNIEYVYYVIASLVNIVMMLNILIAVLVDSFLVFKKDAVQMDYKDKLCVILEIESVFVWKTKQRSGYIQLCDFESKNTENQNISDKIENAAETINERLEEMMRDQDRYLLAFQLMEQKLNLMIKKNLE